MIFQVFLNICKNKILPVICGIFMNLAFTWCYFELTHQTPKLPSYKNQSIDLLCTANQSTGLYMMATLVFNDLIKSF